MQNSILLSGAKFQITLQRLCHQLIENHQDFSDSVIVGIQPRGVYLARRIVKELKNTLKLDHLPSGDLDITFFRDDFRMKGSLPLSPSSTNMDFIVEDKKVILVDDVLWTGRTIRSALDAIQSFGLPTYFVIGQSARTACASALNDPIKKGLTQSSSPYY